MANEQRKMFGTALICAVGAGMMWGLAFFIPKLLSGFTSWEITLGRYLFYGVFSLGLLLIRFEQVKRVSLRIWGMALLYALVGNIGYYLLLVIGIRLSGSTVTTLIIGTLPVTMSLYGNYIKREFPFRLMLLPVTLILAGMLTLQMAGSGGGATGSLSLHNGLGILCALLALAMWTWFGVANAHFLQKHHQIDSSLLITLIGCQTLLITVSVVLFDLWVTREVVSALVSKPHFQAFLLGSFVLGICVSWIAGWLWNIASRQLPVSLLGNLIVLETIFGLLYVYLYEHYIPSLLEFVSMGVVLAGLFLAINRYGRMKQVESHPLSEST